MMKFELKLLRMSIIIIIFDDIQKLQLTLCDVDLRLVRHVTSRVLVSLSRMYLTINSGNNNPNNTV